MLIRWSEDACYAASEAGIEPIGAWEVFTLGASWSQTEMPSEIPLAGRLALNLQRQIGPLTPQQIDCCYAAAEAIEPN